MKGLFRIVLLVSCAAACNNGNSSTTTTPSAPLMTETFTGSVDVQGSDFKTFTVSQNGELDVTLTVAGPPPTIFMGLAVGTPTGSPASACTPASNGTVYTQAGATPQITGLANAGAWCVQVFDIGNQSAPVTYSVTIAHP